MRGDSQIGHARPHPGNLAVFDFELDESELTSIARVNTGQRLGPDPMTFDMR